MFQKQLRCKICNKLIASIKGTDRKCCTNCKGDYIRSRKSKLYGGMTREETIRRLQRKVGEKKEKNYNEDWRRNRKKIYYSTKHIIESKGAIIYKIS